MFTPQQARLVLESTTMETHSSPPTEAPPKPGPSAWAASAASRRLTLPRVLLAVASGAVLGALAGVMLAAAAAPMAGAWMLGAGAGALAGAVVAAAACSVLSALLGAWAMPPFAAQPLRAETAPAASVPASAMADTQPMMLPAAVPASFDNPSDIRDALTGAYTQRYFIAAADREWSRIRRHGEDAALLMIDADHLRRTNETHGQACGDAVLVQLTRLVIATLRQYDLMARFNAGVLVVYLPQTDPIGAIDVAERIRERIANFRMNWPTGAVAVTVSVGVASIGADHAELDQVIGDAGAALRAAKQAGRNCVRAAPVPPKRSPATMLGGDRRLPGAG